MKINVKVKPGSGSERVVQLDNGSLEVWVTAPPENGKANRAVMKAVAKYYKVSAGSIKVLRGKKGRGKLLEVL